MLLLVAVMLRLAAGAQPVTSAPATPAPAGMEIHVAGLVVDYGDGRVTYALVPFTESSISGFELLNRSGLSLLAIEFGGLGQGICAIEDTGCDIGACRARMCQTGDPDSAFWQYAQSGGDGDWTVLPLGASGSTVTDGRIDAWAWSDSSPDPGPLTLDGLAERLGVRLADVRSGKSNVPALVTSGTAPAQVTDSRDGIIGAAIVGAIAVAGGVALMRARMQVRP